MSDVEDTHFGGRVIDREECEEYCPECGRISKIKEG